MPNKICFVSHGLEGGGMERALVSLANYYAEKNCDVSILNIYKTEVFFKIHPSIQIIWPKFIRKNRYVHILRLFPFIRKNIKQIKPDVVFSFGETFNSYVIIALALLNQRLILTNRMWPTLDLGFPTAFLNKYFYRFADGVVAQTNIAKSIIKEKYFNDNVVVIPNAVMPVETEGVPKKNQIISVGRLSKAKGHIVLLRAFSKLPKNDWSLHLVGDGAETEKLKKEAKFLGIADRTIFHGHLKGFSKLMAESKIFVLPSMHEGFPNALVEAMSVPLPCISSNCVAGPADIIRHGENGLLVSPGDENELAAAMEKLIEDEGLRANLAQKAFEVRDTYNFETIAERYLKFLLPPEL